MQAKKPPLGEAFLQHFGVKGMKWGQRRSKEERQAGKLAKAIAKDKVLRVEKKAAKANIMKVAQPVMKIRMDEMFNPGMTPLQYKNLSTQKVVMKKGEEFARITKRENEVLKDKTYVSYRKDDRETYKAIMPVNNPLARGKDYEYVYKATKKLTGPSEKERVDMFIELMNEPKVKHRGKDMTGREFLEVAGLKKQIEGLDNTQVGLREYNRQMAHGLMQDNPIGTAFVSEARKRGYDLVTDDNDRKILSNDPLVILDPAGNLQKVSVRALNKREINQAQQQFEAFKSPERRG